MLCTLIFAAALAFKGAQDAAVVDVTSAEQEGLWREGRQFGLRESDAKRLWDDLLAIDRLWEHEERVGYYERQKIDIVPFLMFLFDDPRIPRRRTPGEGVIDKSMVLVYLGLCDGEQAREALIECAERLLARPPQDETDKFLQQCVIGVMGYKNDDFQVDYLFTLARKEYLGFEGSGYELRRRAVTALARTGNKRVLDAFVSGQVERTRNDLIVAIYSAEELPNLDEWEQKGLGEADLAAAQEIVDWCEDAAQFGVPLATAKKLRKDMYGGPCYPPAYSEARVDIVPFLLHLLQDRELPEYPNAPNQLSEVVVYTWLTETQDSRAAQYILETVQARLEAPVRDYSVVPKIGMLLRHAASWPEGQDLCFALQGEAFWQEREESSTGKDLYDEPGPALSTSYSALTALAESGSDRALNAFATGEYIDSRWVGELDVLFEQAVFAHLKLRHEPRLLSPEKLAEVQEVYARYGKHYELPPPPDPNAPPPPVH